MVGSAAEWFTGNVDVYGTLGSRAEQAVRSALQEQSIEHRRDLRRVGEHLVCGLLVEMAEALAELAAVPKMAGDEIADLAFPDQPRNTLDRIRVAVMKRATSKLITVMIELAGVQQLGPVITALRAAAVATCPDTSDHAAVRRADAALVAEQVGEMTTAALRQTFGGDTVV